MGDWLKLGDTATHLLVRQLAYDWVNEVDARFAIERLDTPAMRPRQSAAEIEEDLKTLTGSWPAKWASVGPAWVGKYPGEGLVNKLKVGSMGSGGTTKQAYVEGLFRLKPDEALIFETTIPEHCRYWNIQLADSMWSALDYTNRQTHINGHFAEVDSDGKFRAVISATDPGVANWLDTMGYREGAIVGRWRECGSDPLPTLTKVKFADLGEYLPDDTVRVTAEQRDEAIRLRKRGSQLRRRW